MILREGARVSTGADTCATDPCPLPQPLELFSVFGFLQAVKKSILSIAYIEYLLH
jgi:hypothetical protein